MNKYKTNNNNIQFTLTYASIHENPLPNSYSL